MRIVFTVELDNRHRQDVEILAACVKDAVVDFNVRTRAEADMKTVRLFSDDAEVLTVVQRAARLERSPLQKEPRE